MRRKTVLRSMIASFTVLALTACGKTTESGNNAYVNCVEPACVADSGDYGYFVYDSVSDPYFYDEFDEGIQFNTEEYDSITENVFKDVSTSPLSTFAADVDSASYSNLRRMINMGYAPSDIPEGAVRAEEMINYFTYDYKGPEGDEPFGINAEISDCPWNREHKLLHLGLQTEAIDFSETPDSNIVLLVDVSGSMSDENKLPLVKESFGMLIDNLSEKDSVSIVTYANGVKVVLDSVSGDDKDTIRNAINRLGAGG